MKSMTIVYSVKNGLYVNLTNRCPCACTFCIRRNDDGAYGSDPLWLEREPSVEEVLAAIEAAKVENYAELVFCGYGEPTERLDDLLEVARRVKVAHPAVKVRVNTNGLSDLIAGAPTAARFAGVVDSISISLNAATPEKYVALCRPRFGSAAYAALLKFAEEIRAVVPSVTMTAVATADFSSADRRACQAICDRLGVTLSVRDYIG